MRGPSGRKGQRGLSFSGGCRRGGCNPNRIEGSSWHGAQRNGAGDVPDALQRRRLPESRPRTRTGPGPDQRPGDKRGGQRRKQSGKGNSNKATPVFFFVKTKSITGKGSPPPHNPGAPLPPPEKRHPARKLHRSQPNLRQARRSLWMLLGREGRAVSSAAAAGAGGGLVDGPEPSGRRVRAPRWLLQN